ncbi:MAG: hypothetical protein QMC89_06310 [Candidatus Hodarchaeaceae archaeon]|nr:hypothetical protein [Candidatus Hodarchaeaceae archaeon]
MAIHAAKQAQRCADALAELGRDPFGDRSDVDIKRWRGPEFQYRLRVGRHRFGYDVRKGQLPLLERRGLSLRVIQVSPTTIIGQGAAADCAASRRNLGVGNHAFARPAADVERSHPIGICLEPAPNALEVAEVSTVGLVDEAPPQPYAIFGERGHRK